MKRIISVVTLLIFLSFTGCTHVITTPVILKQKSAKQIANKICLAIMLSDLSKKDSGFKEKAAAVISQLSKHLIPFEDGKFSLDEAFDRIRSLSDNQGKSLVDPQISVIVELALEDELTGYLEIPGGYKEKLQKLMEIVEIVNQKLKKFGGN